MSPIPDTSEPAYRHPVPAVGAFIFKDDQLLLVRRGAEPAIGKWSIPGGSMEWGETMEEAVKREVLEETGLVVSVGRFAGISDLIVRKEGEITFHYILINYFAEIISGDLLAATDAAEVRWVPLRELRSMDVTQTVIQRLEELGRLGT